MAAYWGVAIPGITSTSLDAFEAQAGKKVSIVGFGNTWYSGAFFGQAGGAYTNFSTSRANLVHSRGGLVLFDWIQGNSFVAKLDDPSFNLRSVYQNHTHDAYITTNANLIKGLGFTIAMRIGHEMNGNWYQSYNEAGPNNLGNGSGEFILMWRYIWSMFSSLQVTNVKWCFNPNNMSSTAGTSTARPLTQFYPGDDFVDILAIDGYNDDAGWKTMQQVMEGGTGTGLANTLQNLKNVTTNPLMKQNIWIGETGCTDTRGGVIDGASKAQWFKDSFGTYLPSRPEIQAIIYSNYIDGSSHWEIDYPLTGSGSGTTVPAFASPTAIGSSYYVAGGTFTVDNSHQPYWLTAANTDHFRTITKSSSGLEGYWRGQEAVGAATLADDSGNGRSATVEGPPTLAVATSVVPSNPTDVSMQFAGGTTTDARLTNASWESPATTGSMTWIVPFLLDSFPLSNGFLLSKGNTNQFENDFYVDATVHKVNFILRNLTNTTSTDLQSPALTVGPRYLAQARLDGSTNTMTLVVSSDTPGAGWGDICNVTAHWAGTLSAGTADFLLGRRNISSDHSLTGKMAHHIIASVPLSDVSLKQIYNAWIAKPVISVPSSGTPGTISATVTWTTDIGATSWVEYGTTAAYGSSTVIDPTLVTSHVVTLDGLATGTVYHYKIHTKNIGGTEAVTTDATFTTAGGAGVVTFMWLSAN